MRGRPSTRRCVSWPIPTRKTESSRPSRPTFRGRHRTDSERVLPSSHTASHFAGEGGDSWELPKTPSVQNTSDSDESGRDFNFLCAVGTASYVHPLRGVGSSARTVLFLSGVLASWASSPSQSQEPRPQGA